jgi:hypothetical protein
MPDFNPNNNNIYLNWVLDKALTFLLINYVVEKGENIDVFVKRTILLSTSLTPKKTL